MKKKYYRVLRGQREKLQIGVRELAAQIGLSAGYISRVERGIELYPPSDKNLLTWAKRLQIDTDELFFRIGRLPPCDLPGFRREVKAVSVLIRAIAAQRRRNKTSGKKQDIVVVMQRVRRNKKKGLDTSRALANNAPVNATPRKSRQCQPKSHK